MSGGYCLVTTFTLEMKKKRGKEETKMGGLEGVCITYSTFTFLVTISTFSLLYFPQSRLPLSSSLTSLFPLPVFDLW